MNKKLFIVLIYTWILSTALIPIVINGNNYISNLLFQSGKYFFGAFFYCSLWSAILLYLFTLKNKKLLLGIMLISSTLNMLLINISFIHLFKLATFAALIIWLACIFHGGIKVVRQKITPNEQEWLTILLSFFLPLSILISSYWLQLGGKLNTKIDDPLLYAIDATLGFYPTFSMGQFLAHLTPAIQKTLYVLYATLPFAWTLVYLLRSQQTKSGSHELINETLLATFLAAVTYYLIPGFGPLCMFAGVWPWHAPSALIDPTALFYAGHFPRNCVPSLHAAWAICIWRHAQVGNRAIRILSMLWLLGLLISTMALGQHYLIDIVIAFAFMTMIRGNCATSLPINAAPRSYAIFFGAGLCVFWFILIFFGIPLLRLSPIIPWVLYSGSIITSCVIEHRLAAANNRFKNKLNYLITPHTMREPPPPSFSGVSE